MPLSLEVFKPFQAKWVNIGELLPDCSTRPLKNFDSEGNKESIIFDCRKDDSMSVIFRFHGSPRPSVPNQIQDHLYDKVDPIVLRRGDYRILELHKRVGGTTKLLKVSHV